MCCSPSPGGGAFTALLLGVVGVVGLVMFLFFNTIVMMLAGVGVIALISLFKKKEPAPRPRAAPRPPARRIVYMRSTEYYLYEGGSDPDEDLIDAYYRPRLVADPRPVDPRPALLEPPRRGNRSLITIPPKAEAKKPPARHRKQIAPRRPADW